MLRVILIWTAVLAGVLVWLPLVRGLTQGAAYQWALTPAIGGRGVGGYYPVLVLAGAYVLTMLYLGWRGARRPFHAMLLIFHLPLAAAVCYLASTKPGELRFEGATLGVSFSLAVLGPVLFVGFLVLAIVWVGRDFRCSAGRAPIPWVWRRSTRIRLGLVITLFALEVILFRSGGLQSPQNLAGVGLVFWQWVMINHMLATSRASHEQNR